MSSEPTISVLTPSYGYGRFIRDAIESVSGQIGAEAEHIVQDGGSTDETIQVLKASSSLWISERDAGQSDALNKALAHANGKWIGWLNADEFYMPDALKVLLDRALSTGADVVYGDAIFVDERGCYVRLLPEHRFSKVVLERYGCYISTCALLVRSSFLAERPFDTRLRLVMDWNLFLNLARNGARFEYVPYPCGAFRVHGERVTATPSRHFQEEFELIRTRFGRHLKTAKHQRLSGLALHAVLKAGAGSYRRQAAGRKLIGEDMRWFASRKGAEATNELLGRVYKRDVRPPVLPLDWPPSSD